MTDRLQPVRCAVIGVGMVGREHAGTLACLPEAQLLGCCDIDPSVAAHVPAGVSFFTEVDRVLDLPDLEAVFVCVPQHLHHEIVVKALNRGRAVFCEKPIASRVEDADAMIRAAAGTDRLLVIGHTLRFDPDFIAVKAAVESGEVGAIVHMSARWCAPDWEGRIISGRTTIPQEMMIHDIDVMQWLAGPVERVYSEASPLSVVGPGPDAAVATLRFRSGAIASLDHSWIVATKASIRSVHQVAVFGDAGAIFLDSQSSPLTIFGRTAYARPENRYYDSRPVGVPSGVVPTEDRHFLRCVREGTEWPVTLADARAALEIAIAIELSMATGKAVDVPA